MGGHRSRRYVSEGIRGGLNGGSKRMSAGTVTREPITICSDVDVRIVDVRATTSPGRWSGENIMVGACRNECTLNISQRAGQHSPPGST